MPLLRIENLERDFIKDKFQHDKINNIFKMDFEIKNETPIFIGEGPLKIVRQDNICCLKTVHAQNKPYIPGSSLKGCIRTYFEYIEPHSCLLNLKRKRESCRINPKEMNFKLCKTCSLFGASGFASRIFFSDAFPTKENIKLKISYRTRSFQPKEASGRVRKYYGKMRFQDSRGYNRKEALLTIPEGTILKSDLIILNPQKDEIGRIFHAMGMRPEKRILKIGGGKHRGFGKIEFRATKIMQGSLPEFLSNEMKILSGIELEQHIKKKMNELIIPNQCLEVFEERGALDNVVRT
ncbi:MAG: RAMP superfamily CRISPR-associated protein [Candidatus Helarchaeota archaeon]